MATKQKMTQSMVSKLGDGWHGAGHNLYLFVRGNSRIWLFRYVSRKTGKRINLTLGRANYLTLDVAKTKAFELCVALAKGQDPFSLLQAEKQKRAELTLKEAFEKYLAHKEKVISPRHKADFLRLAMFNLPKVMDLPVSAVDETEVIKALLPIWMDKRETADRCLSRVLMVLSHCGYTLNKTVITATLPRRPKIITPMRSIHHTQLKEEIARLNLNPSQSSLCLEFIALTALRSATARHLTYSMVDGDNNIINIPKSLFKGSVVAKAQKGYWRLPLTKTMKALIQRSQEMQAKAGIATPYLFCNRNGEVLSDNALSELTRKATRRNALNEDTSYTPHGLRTTFRDWCAENKMDFWASEFQLAHKVLSTTQASYFRSDLLQERTNILNQYHAYLYDAKVIQLKRRA